MSMKMDEVNSGSQTLDEVNMVLDGSEATLYRWRILICANSQLD
jgi:hypothetical protein